MPDKSALGDRMKFYEGLFTEQRLTPGLPVLARLDGKAFHTWTRGLARPYDERLSKLMVATTLFLCKNTNALVGYTQSDEISLVWMPTWESPMMFDGKVFKIIGVLCSMASRYFNRNAADHIPEKADKEADFDCRVWNVPTKEEATNVFVWRELDATRNSISMAAQSKFSHKALQGRSTDEMQEMLWQQGINWNDYPDFFKRGTYVQRRTTVRAFTTDELGKLPPKHAARSNPALTVERKEFVSVCLPPITRILNRVDVIFNGAVPLTSESKV